MNKAKKVTITITMKVKIDEYTTATPGEQAMGFKQDLKWSMRDYETVSHIKIKSKVEKWENK